jgi:hypothetical protein
MKTRTGRRIKNEIGTRKRKERRRGTRIRIIQRNRKYNRKEEIAIFLFAIYLLKKSLRNGWTMAKNKIGNEFTLQGTR